jgi:hypothetical protein
MSTRSAVLVGALVTLIGLALRLGCAESRTPPGMDLVLVDDSPDGRFRIDVYREPMMFSMPGGGGDAPGRILLVDRRTDRVLEEAELEMVQLYERGEWSADTVSIKLIADWRLP